MLAPRNSASATLCFRITLPVDASTVAQNEPAPSPPRIRSVRPPSSTKDWRTEGRPTVAGVVAGGAAGAAAAREFAASWTTIVATNIRDQNPIGESSILSGSPAQDQQL